MKSHKNNPLQKLYHVKEFAGVPKTSRQARREGTNASQRELDKVLNASRRSRQNTAAWVGTRHYIDGVEVPEGTGIPEDGNFHNVQIVRRGPDTGRAPQSQPIYGEGDFTMETWVRPARAGLREVNYANLERRVWSGLAYGASPQNLASALGLNDGQLSAALDSLRMSTGLADHAMQEAIAFLLSTPTKPEKPKEPHPDAGKEMPQARKIRRSLAGESVTDTRQKDGTVRRSAIKTNAK